MARIPYNPKKGQQVKSDAPLKPLERAYLTRYHLSTTEAVAADTDGILPETELTTATSITTGFSNPPCPRALTYDCSAAGVTGNVKVYGTNFADAAITETKALNGQTVVAGVVAFKTITKIDLPAKVHTKAKQSFTMQVTQGPITKDGNVTISMAGNALGEGSPDLVTIALVKDDTAAVTAGKMITALNASTKFKAVYLASLAGTDKVKIEALVEAANDATMVATFSDAGGTGVTMGEAADAVTGVAPDLVFIGYGDILGLPYMSSWKNAAYAVFNGILETTPPTQVADADEIEKNTIDLNSNLDGSAVDIYLVIDNE